MDVLEAIITAIIEFDFADYDHVDLINKGDLAHGVEDWVIDLAVEISDALEPGGAYTAKHATRARLNEQFVTGVQEGRPVVES